MMPSVDAFNLPRSFWLTYYALSGVPAAFTLAIGTLAGGPLHVDDMLLTAILGLGLVNVWGAWHQARPVRGTHQSPHGVAACVETMRELPRRCGRWICLLMVGFLDSHHALAHSGAGWSSMSEFVYPLGLIAVYAALMGVSQYFAVGALVAATRRVNVWSAIGGRAPRSGLARRLIAAVATTAFVPLALVLVHREMAASIPPHHAPHLKVFLVLDLAAAALILGAAVVFFMQTVTRPVEDLLRCMERLRAGALETRAGMVTDDELGALALGFNSMAEELEERAFLQESLGRFVPETVASAVRADHGVVRPREAEATILYSDIEGFTRLCQSHAPHTVFALLNEYFGALSACVRAWGGVITQFQGDAMLVTFNLPLADPDHALSAVRAALDILRCVEVRHFGDDVTLRTRIGINTGRVVAGTVGDGARLGYTVHGDAVNIAQRLEQANKQTGTRVLLSARTAELLEGKIDVRPLGPVLLPGRDGTLAVYTVDQEVAAARVTGRPTTSGGQAPGEKTSKTSGTFAHAPSSLAASRT